MSEEQFFKDKTESNFFVQIIQKYIPFWPVFVITTFICVTIAYVYLRSQVPIYIASGKVLLKDPDKGIGDTKVLDALNIFSEKKIVENEIVVLRSTTLMEEVVRDLDLYTGIYNEGKVRTEELYGANSPLWFIGMQKDSIYSTGKYYFKIDWKKKNIFIDNKYVSFDSTIVLDNNLYQIVVNDHYNKNLSGKNYYVEFSSIPEAASALIENLKVSPISSASTVLDVKLETPVKEKGKMILTKLFQAYNKAAIDDKNQAATNTLNFINERLGLVKSQLDTVEKNVQGYKSSRNVIDLGAQAKLYLDQMKDLDAKGGEVSIQLEALDNIDNYLNTKGNRPGTAPSLLLIEDPGLTSLVQKLNEAEIQLEKEKSRSGEKSDALIFAENQVNQLRSSLRENTVNIRKNLLSVKSNVNSNIAQSSGLLRQVPQQELGLMEIGRNQNLKNSLYQYLYQKREETALSQASTTTDLRVIEAASAYGPIKPVPKNFYFVGFIAGILLAVLFVLIREQFNRRILFRDEIESKTKIPVVGEIVQVVSKDPIVIYDGKRTIIAEQFRSLRTNLSFMGLNEDNKTILITSSISGEGKSFVAINLAISFTLIGKKVAILEMDLRKPKVSKLLQVNRDPGISSFLIGKEPIDNIIKETSLKDLYLVSSGPIPPNPTELISSLKFKEMMEELKQRFDYLIIDTAPVGPVSDALLLKDYPDTTIFVVRHNVTPKSFLNMIDDLHRQKKFKNMCLVFNGLKKRGYLYGGNGYGSYGQGYGYGSSGYGYYVKDDEKKGLLSKIRSIFTF